MKTEKELVKSLTEEYDELKIKVDKLSKFIDNTDLFSGLSILDRILLSDQQDAMLEYLEILKERIALHSEYIKKVDE